MKAYLIADLLACMEKEYLEQGYKEHAEALHEALAIIRRASHEDDDPISEPARAHLFPLMKRAKLELNDLKKYLRTAYGISSTKAIPWSIYEDVCQWLIKQGDHVEERKQRVSKRPKSKQGEANKQLSLLDKKAS